MGFIEFLFGFLAVFSTILLIFTQNLVRAAFLFFLVLFAVAGLFVLNGSDYLGLVQVMIGIGGILILLLFGVMITQRYHFLFPQNEKNQTWLALILCILLGFFLISTFKSLEPSKTDHQVLSLKVLGFQLITEHLPAFELVSLLLLLALVGAAWLVRKS